MTSLSLTDVSLGYGNQPIVSQVNFTIEKGEMVALIGENGSGKSTLMKGILGILPLIKGRIEKSPMALGYMPQSPKNVYFPASVKEVLLLGRASDPLFSQKKKREKLKEVARSLALEELFPLSFSSLSLGQKQRVLLGRALMAGEELLLLDEPMASVDPLRRKEFSDLLFRLHEEGLGILWITHRLEELKDRVDRVLLLEQGQLREISKEEALCIGSRNS